MTRPLHLSSHMRLVRWDTSTRIKDGEVKLHDVRGSTRCQQFSPQMAKHPHGDEAGSGDFWMGRRDTHAFLGHSSGVGMVNVETPRAGLISPINRHSPAPATQT